MRLPVELLTLLAPPTPWRCPSTIANVPPPNEFARTIAVAGLGRKATRNVITATTDECVALAGRFDLEGLGSLAANVSLAIVDPRRSRVRAYGKFTASDVVQRSVMSDSVTLQIDAVPFETFFVDEALDGGGDGRYDSDDEEGYDEPIEEGLIDMGELVAQHLYLHLSDLERERFQEFRTDAAPGTVVFDTDNLD